MCTKKLKSDGQCFLPLCIKILISCDFEYKQKATYYLAVHPSPKKKNYKIGLGYFCVTYRIFLINLRVSYASPLFQQIFICNYSLQDDSVGGRRKYKDD